MALVLGADVAYYLVVRALIQANVPNPKYNVCFPLSKINAFDCVEYYCVDCGQTGSANRRPDY